MLWTPAKSILTRRSFLRGLFAAPAIVAAANIMPVKALVPLTTAGPLPIDGSWWQWDERLQLWTRFEAFDWTPVYKTDPNRPSVTQQLERGFGAYS